MTMDCHEARQIFTGAADAAAPMRSSPRLAAAEAHVAACTACQTRLDQLAKAVLSMADDELSCAECGAQLHTYVEADLVGGDAAAALPLVHAHLATCPECRGDFGEARLALADLALGRLPQPENVPDFDTSFLRPTPRPAARDLRWLGRAAAVALLLVAGGLAATRLVLTAWPGSPAVLGGVFSPGGAPDDTPRSNSEQALRPAPGGPTAPERPPSGDRSASARSGATPIARQHATVLATPAGEDASRRAALSPGAQAGERVAAAPPGPRSPVILPPASATTAPAVPPLPVIPPTAAPGAPATDEPDDEPPAPTAVPVPTAAPTPTPVMVTRCELEQAQLDGGELSTRCAMFPQLSQFDLYTFQVENRSRWAFSLCNRTAMDTIVALYVAGTFDPAGPCQGIVAYNDDFCDTQSRLTVDLDPGTYWFLIADKSGDENKPYRFKTEAEEGAVGSPCPVEIWLPTATDPATATPTDPATATPTDAATATPTAAPIAAQGCCTSNKQ